MKTMKNNKVYKIFSYCIIAVVMLTAMICSVNKVSADEVNNEGYVSSNIHQQGYFVGVITVNGNWANVVRSYMYEGDKDTLFRVEEVDNKIIIETYSKKDFTLKSTKVINMELNKFGGFFAGTDYNYLIFGQDNEDEDNNREVVRIVQYTKEWKRTNAAGLYGANVVFPFHAGSLRVCEAGNMLYIRTCHTMYKREDGLNHQANMTICYRQDKGTITHSASSGICSFSKGYVSHSLNQFIESDGSNVYAVDHGDAHPRAIVLLRYSNPAGSEALTDIDSSAELIEFPDEIGFNYTGASLGGLEVNDSTCLVAYNTVDQEYFYGSVRNIFVSVVDKNSIGKSEVTTKQFTEYDYLSDKSASNPVLVSLPDGNYMLMWEIYNSYEIKNVNGKPGTHTIQYVKIDNKGDIIGSIHTEEGDLSDCKPIVTGNKLVWYVTDESAPVFYTIDLKTEKLECTYTYPLKATPSPSPTPYVAPTEEPSQEPSPTRKPESTTVVKKTLFYWDDEEDIDTQPEIVSISRVTGVKLTNKKRQRITVKWSKANNVSYYQVQIARNRSFSKGKQTSTEYRRSCTFSYLKRNKTYYVRVRGCSGSRYGSWSSIKKIKVRK